MAEWQEETREEYRRKGFGVRSGYGVRPALLIVDFINGFTDPSTPLGGDLSEQVFVTGELLAAFRRAAMPVVYTTIAFAPDLSDGGMWLKKVPSLEILKRGTATVDVDDRLRRQAGEKLLEKQGASAFFATGLDAHLRELGVDTVVITGCTTSGCVRASAIDSLQYNYFTIVVEDGVGDRAEGPHEANLFDIDAKYGDVVPGRDVLGYMRSLRGRAPGGGEDVFRQSNQPTGRATANTVAPGSGADYSSEFDAALSDTKTRLDGMYGGSTVPLPGDGPPARPDAFAPAPADRDAGDVARPSPAAHRPRFQSPASDAARYLNDRYGNRWRSEFDDRRREGNDIVVGCTLTINDGNISLSRVGRARIAQPPARSASAKLASAGGVAFTVRPGNGSGAGDAEERAFHEATEDALASCVAAL